MIVGSFVLAFDLSAQAMLDVVNAYKRRYADLIEPLFDGPCEQIRRIPAGFETATASDRLSIAATRVLKWLVPAQAKVVAY